jgi:2-polyprenyl-3-methyl-5-hydroxy-6-metoxy-1,4-benzoquinol methylase
MEQNETDWTLPLSKAGKLQAGLYLILRDYERGLFPPQFPDRQIAYQAEVDYAESIPGVSSETVNAGLMTKPFVFGGAMDTYLTDFTRICAMLTECGVRPPARILELGCGHGWMTEFLTTGGYHVTGTSIADDDILWARKRIPALQTKGIVSVMSFEVSPMEEVAERVGPKGGYDAVFVYAALHHAFDWREAIQSATDCLKPGGWLLICCEPNVFHTFISYRVARLTNTHEVGMSGPALRAQMRRCGLTEIRNFGPRLHFWLRAHWLAGQKPEKVE